MEVVRTIIYPFKYDDLYIPCLSIDELNILKSPFPCFVGIYINNEDEFELISECTSEHSILVHLDRNQLYINHKGKCQRLDACLQEYYPKQAMPMFFK